MFLKFLKDTNASTMIEYGLIAALISTAIIAGATVVGTNINDTIQGAADVI